MASCLVVAMYPPTFDYNALYIFLNVSNLPVVHVRTTFSCLHLDTVLKERCLIRHPLQLTNSAIIFTPCSMRNFTSLSSIPLQYRQSVNIIQN